MDDTPDDPAILRAILDAIMEAYPDVKWEVLKGAFGSVEKAFLDAIDRWWHDTYPDYPQPPP